MCPLSLSISIYLLVTYFFGKTASSSFETGWLVTPRTACVHHPLTPELWSQTHQFYIEESGRVLMCERQWTVDSAFY